MCPRSTVSNHLLSGSHSNLFFCRYQSEANDCQERLLNDRNCVDRVGERSIAKLDSLRVRSAGVVVPGCEKPIATRYKSNIGRRQHGVTRLPPSSSSSPPPAPLVSVTAAERAEISRPARKDRELPAHTVAGLQAGSGGYGSNSQLFARSIHCPGIVSDLSVGDAFLLSNIGLFGSVNCDNPYVNTRCHSEDKKVL